MDTAILTGSSSVSIARFVPSYDLYGQPVPGALETVETVAGTVETVALVIRNNVTRTSQSTCAVSHSDVAFAHL